MGNDPAVVSRELETKADSWLPLTNDVGKLLPPNRTVAPDTKPEPNTDSVKPPLPCCTEFGLRLLMSGKTRLETGVMLNIAIFEGKKFWETTTLTLPALVRSDAGTLASSRMLLTNVVGTGVPLNCTVAPCTK